MLAVYNEDAIFLGYVEDESFLWQYDYEVYMDTIVVLNTSAKADQHIANWICN